MSNAHSELSSELEKVVARVAEVDNNGLSDQQDSIPELTELYAGEKLSPLSTANQDLGSEPPTLESFVDEAVALVDAPVDAIDIEGLMAEMMPRIKLEVKKAVLQEMIEIEKELCKKVEKNLVKALYKELKSRQKLA